MSITSRPIYLDSRLFAWTDEPQKLIQELKNGTNGSLSHLLAIVSPEQVIHLYTEKSPIYERSIRCTLTPEERVSHHQRKRQKNELAAHHTANTRSSQDSHQYFPPPPSNHNKNTFNSDIVPSW